MAQELTVGWGPRPDDPASERQSHKPREYLSGSRL